MGDFIQGIEKSKDKLFKQYMDMMLRYNQKINLTAITEESEIIEKHFIDSLTVLESGKIQSGCRLIDIGAGAGFPSIPIKIMNENISVTMLDALQKRVDFLREVIKELGLKDIEALHMRAEEGGQDKNLREKFDISVARAVADLAVLSEYALPFVKKGGYFIAMKGNDIEKELENAKEAIKILGGKTEKVIEILLPSGIKHSLIIIKKIDETPAKYPRKAGKPSRDPLGSRL